MWGPLGQVRLRLPLAVWGAITAAALGTTYGQGKQAPAAKTIWL